MHSGKVKILSSCHSRLDRESSSFNCLWTPALVGASRFSTYYETIMITIWRKCQHWQIRQIPILHNSGRHPYRTEKRAFPATCCGEFQSFGRNARNAKSAKYQYWEAVRGRTTVVISTRARNPGIPRGLPPFFRMKNRDVPVRNAKIFLVPETKDSAVISER